MPSMQIDGRRFAWSALAALWPETSVERIAGGGHAFMAQEPERVAAPIADFAAPQAVG